MKNETRNGRKHVNHEDAKSIQIQTWLRSLPIGARVVFRASKRKSSTFLGTGAFMGPVDGDVSFRCSWGNRTYVRNGIAHAPEDSKNLKIPVFVADENTEVRAKLGRIVFGNQVWWRTADESLMPKLAEAKTHPRVRS